MSAWRPTRRAVSGTEIRSAPIVPSWFPSRTVMRHRPSGSVWPVFQSESSDGRHPQRHPGSRYAPSRRPSGTSPSGPGTSPSGLERLPRRPAHRPAGATERHPRVRNVTLAPRRSHGVVVQRGGPAPPSGVKVPLRGAATVAARIAIASTSRPRHRASLLARPRPSLDPRPAVPVSRHPAEQGQALLRLGAEAETLGFMQPSEKLAESFGSPAETPSGNVTLPGHRASGSKPSAPPPMGRSVASVVPGSHRFARQPHSAGAAFDVVRARQSRQRCPTAVGRTSWRRRGPRRDVGDPTHVDGRCSHRHQRPPPRASLPAALHPPNTLNTIARGDPCRKGAGRWRGCG